MGSSDSRPEPPKRQHFTEVNARLLADLTTNSTNQCPTSIKRVVNNTPTRAPNYVYQVPRDEHINLGARANSSAAASGLNQSRPIEPFSRSAAASGSTIKPTSSTTMSTPSRSSVSVNSSTTVPRPANSSMPSTTSSVSTSTLGKNANTSVTRNENSSVNSNASTVSTPKPLVSTASGSNTSSMNSKFENLDLNNANSTINHFYEYSSGTISPAQYLLNIRNSELKEILSYANQGSPEHKKNAFHRRRNNNASGVTQAGPRTQFNNRSVSDNRQPRDGNHRQRNIYPSNIEETRGNRTNRPNDSGNRQHPRNRNPRNVFSVDRPTGNSGDDKTKEVHDAFMKKMVGAFPPNYDKFRGLFCAACNHYEVFIGRRPNVKHIDTPKHTSNIGNNPRIKSLRCFCCRIMLLCDIQFLVAHKQSEIHMFIADQKPRSAEACAEPSKEVDNVVKGDNTLNLKEDIKKKFLQRMDMSSEMSSDYSFYCHLCEQWFTNHEVWDAHLKNQHDGNDTKLMNMTFKHCQQCKLMMCGSRLLSFFHADADEHEKFRTFLNIPSAESSDEDNSDARDDVSTTSSAAAKEQQSQKPVYLVLKNLPPTATKRDIFAYFKDFGHLENWTMNPIGENTAVVQFRFGSVAENIINSKFPLEIHGLRIDACLQYL